MCGELFAFLLLLLSSSTSVESRRSGRKGDGGDGRWPKDNATLLTEERRGKVMSLFSLVHFENGACSSSATLPGSDVGRNGTCYTLGECQGSGGSAQGSCAAGFGVCCLFSTSSSGESISQNNTYVQNPGFPNPYSIGAAASVTYRVEKINPEVCQLRLDFETFTLQATGASADLDSVAVPNEVAECKDTFNVQATSHQLVPTICGENSGQHIYVEFGANPGDTVSLQFAFTGSSTVRKWDIKVAQMDCGADHAAPSGCLQYHTGLTGQLKTFNFDALNSNHLPNQRYTSCLRRESGMCCVEYRVCRGVASAFSLTGETSPAKAATDDLCRTEDHLVIPASSSKCANGPFNVGFKNRYCGVHLNDQDNAETDVPICSCSTPFSVEVQLNGLADSVSTETSRGACLEWSQVACSG